MQAGARPYVLASAALAATGLVAVTPIALRPFEKPIVSQPVRLVDAGDSLLNIPFNLFQDIVNIPSNEVEAVNAVRQRGSLRRDHFHRERDEHLW